MLSSTRWRCALLRSTNKPSLKTKNFVNVASLPSDTEIGPEWDACIASIRRPASQKRINTLMERGFQALVDALAMRIASFDKQAIAETKNFVNIASLPPTQKLRPNGTHVLPLFSAPRAREESTHCWSVACSRNLLALSASVWILPNA
jgi:hypothetical protein